MLNDVAKAFFEADMIKELCVEIPTEDKTEEDWNRDNVGFLKKSLYGTRDAAANFQREVGKVMTKNGFSTGKYNVSTYMHPDRNLKTLVHGDDFVTVGRRKEVVWFKKALEERFEIKTKIIGRGKNDLKEARILNRVVRITPEGWEYEADQRHAEIIINSLGLEESKEVTTAGEDSKPWKEEEEEEKLDKPRAAEYRALAARANFLALDRADIQYATKEVCRGMASPTLGDWRKLKRFGRYLKGKPRVVSRFEWQAR